MHGKITFVGVFVYFAVPAADKSGLFKAESKTADAREKV
jgi:hypothetical protein